MIPSTETLLRVFLPVYFLLFVLVGGPIRVWIVRRRYGVDPLALEDPDPLMEFGERCRDALLLVVLALCFAYAFFPGVHARLGPVRFLEIPALRLVGALILVASLVVIAVAQGQLRDDWRFGVDLASPPGRLVTTGLFAFSRNPIYLGLLGAGAGLFLALPNAVTSAVTPVAWVLLGTRVRVEEAFLEEAHADEFRAYRRRTPRWLGWPSGG